MVIHEKERKKNVKRLSYTFKYGPLVSLSDKNEYWRCPYKKRPLKEQLVWFMKWGLVLWAYLAETILYAITAGIVIFTIVIDYYYTNLIWRRIKNFLGRGKFSNEELR